MKKIILLVLSILPFLGWAQLNGNFKLKVKGIVMPPIAKMYLNYEIAGQMKTDTGKINNGTIEFSGALTEPVEAQVVLDSKGIGQADLQDDADMVIFYLEKGELVLSTKDSLKKAQITGSKVNQENETYQSLIKPVNEKSLSLMNEYGSKTLEQLKDPAYVKSVMTRDKENQNELNEINKKFHETYPNSYIALVALKNGLVDFDVAEVEPQYNSFPTEIKVTPLGKRVGEIIISAKKTQVGQQAMDFTQNDVNGKPVKLSDFKGKYVLLDFWASWCGPCRSENPNVVQAYNSYKNKNFTVLSVSLDQPGKTEAWLAAIKEDGMEWTQVSDLKFWSNEVAKLYGVSSIPQNYLIDPFGKIVARNLRGEQLTEKLASLLK